MNEIINQIHQLSKSKDLQEKIVTWVNFSKSDIKNMGINEKERILLETNKLSLRLGKEEVILPGTFMTENLLTNLLPILHKGLKDIVPTGIPKEIIKSEAEKVSNLIETKRSNLKEQYKEVFIRLRKRIEREIDQTKYNSLQAFSKLSKDISSLEEMPELNLQLNPIEIYDAFNHIKNSLKSILTNHSVQLEEDFTILVSELMTSLERKVHLLGREISEKNQELMEKFSSERTELEKKRKELKRQIIRETEILKYELEKLLKKTRTTPVSKLDIEMPRKAFSEEEIREIVEIVRQGTDKGLIIVRKELEKGETKIKDHVEQFIDKIINSFSNSLNDLVSQYSFLKKEKNDIFSGITNLVSETDSFLGSKKQEIIRVTSENQYQAKELDQVLNQELELVHDKVGDTLNDFVKEIIQITTELGDTEKQLLTGFNLSQELLNKNDSFNKNFENLGKRIAKLVSDADKNKKPEKLIKQIKDISKQFLEVEKEVKESNALIGKTIEVFNETTNNTRILKEKLLRSITAGEKKANILREIITQTKQLVLSRSKQLLGKAQENEEIISDCIISTIQKINQIRTHFDHAKKRTEEIDRGFIETLQEALDKINLAKQQEKLEFWKTWGNLMVDTKSRTYTSLKHHFDRYLENVFRSLKERSVNDKSQLSEETTKEIDLSDIINKSGVLVSTYSNNILKILDVNISPIINIIEIAETMTKDTSETILKQLQSDIVSLKEDLINKREVKSKEIEKQVEAINVKLVHSFNQLEDKLGKIIENLLESYDILSGISPDLIQATYLNVNETLDRLMNSIQTKLLEEVNEAHETLLKNDPFLEIENKMHELKRLVPEEDETVIKEKLTKQILYPINEIIRDLGIFNGNILMLLETKTTSL